ncbi:MAG: alpha/beta hydrolase family protein [Acidimicrobiales bacterium]
MAPDRFDQWFMYFPGSYRWSAALTLVLGSAPYGGAELGEVDAVGRQLLDRVGDDEAWFAAWAGMGDAVRRTAEDAAAAGRSLTAAAGFLRASSYYHIGERFQLPKDEAALDAYRKGVDSFGRYAALVDGPRVERVEVPFEGTSLPAYLTLPERGESPFPCVVYFDGLDITKELQFVRGVDELRRRGVGCLVVDGPGNGESIRFRGLPLRPDYEAAGSAALDYLAGRPEVDPARVGVMGISLGGYYAARCASREPRFAACVCWGGIWDYHATWQRRIAEAFGGAMSVAGDHICWVLGCDTFDEALDLLGAYALDGVVQDMRCPYLLLHGARDEQIPLADAEAVLAAVGSADKELRVFDERTGGATHCQNDRLTAGTVAWADWFADRLAAAGG